MADLFNDDGQSNIKSPEVTAKDAVKLINGLNPGDVMFKVLPMANGKMQVRLQLVERERRQDVAAGRSDNAVKVLLVDDDHFMRHEFAEIMRAAGMEVFEASDGEEGLKAISGRHFDVVVSDNHMPNLSGATMMRVVADKYPDTIRILATGNPLSDKDAEEHGVHVQIAKPYKPSVLLSAVESQLRRKLKERQVKAKKKPS
jgi:CheY-like chemotaxis protein